MTDPEWDALRPLESVLERHGEGKVAFCLGLAVTLYFEDAYTEEKRRAALECFNDYQRICGALLRWWVVENGRPGQVAKLRNRDMRTYLLSPKWDTPAAYEEAWAFLWHGGERFDDANPFSIEGFGTSKAESDRRDNLSYLRASFPVTWFLDKNDDVVELVLRWSRALKPLHGYGGVTLIESPSDGLAQMYGGKISGIAMRYPGIEIDDPMGHAMKTKKGIKGGNWVTVLGTKFLDELGGAAELRQRLGDPFRVEEYAGGAVIVAGPVPEIGDRNAALDTPLYRKLAKVLKPIRIRKHPPVTIKGALSEEGSFEAWMARFDD